MLLSFIFFLLELGIFYLYWEKRLQLTALLLLHTLVTLISCLAIYGAYKEKQPLTLPFLRSLFIAIMGPFGAFGLLLQELLTIPLKRSVPPPEEWFKGLFPERTVSPFTLIFERIQAGWDDYTLPTDVLSFHDVFYYGTREQKQAVLDLFIADFRPNYAPLLLQAVKDPSNIVRIHAATAMQKIEIEYEKRLEKIVEQNEKLHNQKQYLLNLAHYYDDLSTLGILEEGRKKKNEELALHFYRTYLPLDPDNKTIFLNIATLLYHTENFVEYLAWCKEYEKKFQLLPEILRSWSLEALYKLKRYEELATAEEVP